MRRTTMLRRSLLALALLALALLALALLAPGLARAQRDTIPTRVHPDSIPVIDSLPAPVPREPMSTGRILLGTAGSIAFLAAVPFASSATLLFPGAYRVTSGDSTERDFLRSSVHPWASVGMGPGLGARRRADFSGTAALGLDVLTAGFVVEGRWEHAWIPEHLELRTARAGYLAHPRGGLMGGLVVGYRDTRGPGMLRGVDFGFPLVIAVKDGGWLRGEPSYVVSSRRRFVMSYRVEAVPPRSAKRPWLPAVIVEGRGFSENDGALTVSAQFGMRTRMP